MRLVEKDNCCIIEGVFDERVLCGFTKTGLTGELPSDAQRACSFLGADLPVAYMRQPHGSLVSAVSGGGLHPGDGIFTSKPGLILAARTADCLPVFFYDRQQARCGIVHMGWRSARAGILDNIGDISLSSRFIFGVGLRRCCFEVGREFCASGGFDGNVGLRDGRCYFDPVGFARRILVKRGFSAGNFYDLGLCSFCAREIFFPTAGTGRLCARYRL